MKDRESQITFGNAFEDGMLNFCSDGLYGFINIDGNSVIAPQFSNAGPFVDGVAVVEDSDNRSGMIDKKGNTIIPFRYFTILWEY